MGDGSEAKAVWQSTHAPSSDPSLLITPTLCSPPVVGSRGLIRQLNRRKEGRCVCCEETHKLPGMYCMTSSQYSSVARYTLQVTANLTAVVRRARRAVIIDYCTHRQTDLMLLSSVSCAYSFSTLHDTFIPRLYSSECTLSLFLSWSLQQTQNIILPQTIGELDLVLLKEPLVSCRRLPYIAYRICLLIQQKNPTISRDAVAPPLGWYIGGL